VYRSYEIFGFVAIVYFVCCYALSLASTALERRFAVPDGGGGETRAVTGALARLSGSDLRRPE
jgi:hypothetical protein